ncbi:MAG: hypothetical protein HYU63_04425 [Armatimonadetes bacterium]|nr:hypothetical protein [Armatimonadota bacterium]
MPSLTLISLDENLEKLNILKPLNEVLEIKDIKKIKPPKLTFNPDRKQYFSTSLLHFLELQRKDRQEIILGIINSPIYTPGLTSAIGESSPKRGVAVVSAYLLNNNEIIKEAFHEIGHIFLLNHCDFINCFMHCSEDKKPSQKQEFCQNCQALIKKNKAKLNFSKNFESLSLVYSSKSVSFGEHIFPVEKYSLIYQVLKENRLFKNTSFYEAPEAEFEDLLLAHDLEYLNDLKELKLTPRTLFSEIPINKEIMDFFISHAGGTILAGFLALKEGVQ